VPALQAIVVFPPYIQDPGSRYTGHVLLLVLLRDFILGRRYSPGKQDCVLENKSELLFEKEKLCGNSVICVASLQC
jgi:hypothetical protein